MTTRSEELQLNSGSDRRGKTHHVPQWPSTRNRQEADKHQDFSCFSFCASFRALQPLEKNHPALPSSRNAGCSKILQESSYFCAISSTDAQRLPTTVISMGWTGSSKPYGKNDTELQLPQVSQSSLLIQSRVHFCK